MSDEKNKTEEQTVNSENRVNPGDIEGKIDVPDKRERRDGPGGD